MAKVNYLGYFPFCVAETTDGSLVGTNTGFPIGFTLEDACFLFWKAKQLSFDCHYNYTEYIQTGHGYDPINNQVDIVQSATYYDWPLYNIGGSTEFGKAFLPQSETDFICFNQQNSIWFDNINFEPFVLFAYSNYYTTPFCYKYNNLYYLNLAWIPSIIGSYVGIATLPGAVIRLAGSFILTINNNTYNLDMWYVDNSNVPNIGAYDIVNSCSGTITISETWPYNP